jgi:hypothetical protein
MPAARVYFGTMIASWLRRFRTLALTLVVLSGGGGVSLVDALLYHRSADSHLADARIAAADDTAGHADSCLLGVVALGGGLMDRPADCFRSPMALGLSLPQLSERPRAARTAAANCSRAPPIRSV